MNLATTQRGYAVMNKELTAISLDGYSVDELKRYCGADDVIAERIPKVHGFSINIHWFKDFEKAISLKRSMKNVFNLHWTLINLYRHRTGKVVYKDGIDIIEY